MHKIEDNVTSRGLFARIWIYSDCFRNWPYQSLKSAQLSSRTEIRSRFLWVYKLIIGLIVAFIFMFGSFLSSRHLSKSLLKYFFVSRGIVNNPSNRKLYCSRRISVGNVFLLFYRTIGLVKSFCRLLFSSRIISSGIQVELFRGAELTTKNGKYPSRRSFFLFLRHST